MDCLHNECEPRATKIIYVPVNKDENLLKPVLVYCDDVEVNSKSTIRNR